jgi:hypothetical protein
MRYKKRNYIILLGRVSGGQAIIVDESVRAAKKRVYLESHDDSWLQASDVVLGVADSATHPGIIMKED